MEFVSNELPQRDTRPVPPKRNVDEEESPSPEGNTKDIGENDSEETQPADADPTDAGDDGNEANQIPVCASCCAAIQSQVAPITCKKCLSTRYCSHYCRQMDWEVGGHRDACTKLQETSDKSIAGQREDSPARHRPLSSRRIPPPRTYSSESKEERFNYYRRKKKRSESFSSDDSVDLASVDTQGLRGLLSKRFGRHGRKKGPEKQYTNDDDLTLSQYMNTVSGRTRSKSFDLDEYAAEVLAKDGGHIQFSAEHGVFLSNVRMASVRAPTLASLGATSLSNIFRKKRFIDPALEIDADGEILYGVDLDDGLDPDVPQLYMEPSLTKRLYVRIRRHCVYVYVCGFLALMVLAVVLPVGLHGKRPEDSSAATPQSSVAVNKHSSGTTSAGNHAPSPTAVTPSTTHHSTPSGAPLANPTSASFRDEFYEALRAGSFDDNSAVDQEGTPQNKAFEWLVQSADASQLSPERRLQRFALATFFYSTGGESWANNTGWMDEQVHECEWFTSDPPENVCDTEGNYKVLALDSNDVGDVIPLEIGLLTGLGKLSLEGGPKRKIGGILPSSLGKLALLRQMDVKGNAIRGTIPSEIGSLRYLRLISLTANLLSGTIPSSIKGLMQMTSFRADSNMLSGTLPAEFGLLLNLAQLFLGKNKFGGAIPVGVTSLESLKILDLENNNFTSMPVEMALLQNLQHLSVANNPLVGTLMTEIGSLSNLKTLNLHATGMTGRIPTTIGNLQSLQQLDLSYNRFSGTIPTEFGMLAELADIALNANHLTGSMPVQLSQPAKLHVLLLQENDLSVGVSTDICTNLLARDNLAFYADCGGEVPEFQCSCCTHCCVDGQRCDFAP